MPHAQRPSRDLHVHDEETAEAKADAEASTEEDAAHHGHPPVSASLIWVLSILSGVTVANLYYANPLLELLRESFDVDEYRAASINALLQGGYCAGLLFVTPLGDLLPRKHLILTLVFTCGLLSLGLAYAPFLAFQTLSFVMGVATVAPQIIIPLTADLSAPQVMGSNVGKVLSGTQIGILLARVLSGVLADHITYHGVFLLAGGLQLVLALIVVWLMPAVPRNNNDMSLWEVYKSCWVLLTREPKLQQCSIIALLCYASFATFWTTSTFLLANDPYHYTSTQIGLLGLAGISGTLFAAVGGKLADHIGGSFFVILIGIVFKLIAWTMAVLFGTRHIAAPIVAAFCLDGGRRMQQLANQLRVYTISSTARSRVNAVYMIIGYSGTFIGSLVGTACWVAGGWTLVCGAGFSMVGAALVAWAAWNEQGRFRLSEWYRRYRYRQKPRGGDVVSGVATEEKGILA
ncbi:MFS general substrate transporter [Gonapodya prolifera JEL478]|uniref:MFS general substrate transporter n=1 Tax=Gonapodya prolifera (strain JEL478) TaxID=1344416 RepID=A0A139A5Z3_GONPJ|nr:MFS general substrate transporter [Gonapodya prolifera JEL478]|eukprot:KXS12216.1 MFS general substrate transporter [Gonapodya prolifera JEL478]